MNLNDNSLGRIFTFVALSALANVACGGLEGADDLADVTESEDELGRRANPPATNTYFLLQNGRYKDIFYSPSAATITNPLGSWVADGNTLKLFASPSACAGAVQLVQCSPYPHSYSHYISTWCYAGSNPVTLGPVGYVCPTVEGTCAAGSSLLYAGSYNGVTYDYPFVNGLAFGTTLLVRDLSTLTNNGEIRFAPIVPYGCAP